MRGENNTLKKGEPNNSEILELIGGMIQQARQFRHITQAELAELMGNLDKGRHIRRIENGSRNITIKYLWKICSLMNCKIRMELIPLEDSEDSLENLS